MYKFDLFRRGQGDTLATLSVARLAGSFVEGIDVGGDLCVMDNAQTADVGQTFKHGIVSLRNFNSRADHVGADRCDFSAVQDFGGQGLRFIHDEELSFEKPSAACGLYDCRCAASAVTLFPPLVSGLRTAVGSRLTRPYPDCRAFHAIASWFGREEEADANADRAPNEAAMLVSGHCTGSAGAPTVFVKTLSGPRTKYST